MVTFGILADANLTLHKFLKESMERSKEKMALFTLNIKEQRSGSKVLILIDADVLIPRLYNVCWLFFFLALIFKQNWLAYIGFVFWGMIFFWSKFFFYPVLKAGAKKAGYIGSMQMLKDGTTMQWVMKNVSTSSFRMDEKADQNRRKRIPKHKADL